MQRKLLVALTLMLAGRAMTLAFIGDVGGAAPGDPPQAWLMPLIGDAVIGIAALPVAVLAWRGTHSTIVVVWNAIGIWDAMSAFLVHLSAPWPSFFMIEIFGASMFFAASAMHLVCLYLLTRSSSVELPQAAVLT